MSVSAPNCVVQSQNEPNLSPSMSLPVLGPKSFSRQPRDAMADHEGCRDPWQCKLGQRIVGSSDGDGDKICPEHVCVSQSEKAWGSGLRMSKTKQLLIINYYFIYYLQTKYFELR